MYSGVVHMVFIVVAVCISLGEIAQAQWMWPNDDFKLNEISKNITQYSWICPKNQVYRTDDRPDRHCYEHLQFEFGKSNCICKPGYRRNFNGACIPKKMCVLYRCPENTVPNVNNIRQKNCDDKEYSELVYRPSCICRDDLVWHPDGFCSTVMGCLIRFRI